MSQNKPIKTYKHSTTGRSVEAAVWANESESGNVFYSTTFTVQYRDGEEWKTSKGYGVSDLYQLIRCATDAAAFIFFEEMKQRRELGEAA